MDRIWEGTCSAQHEPPRNLQKSPPHYYYEAALTIRIAARTRGAAMMMVLVGEL